MNTLISFTRCVTKNHKGCSGMDLGLFQTHVSKQHKPQGLKRHLSHKHLQLLHLLCYKKHQSDLSKDVGPSMSAIVAQQALTDTE